MTVAWTETGQWETKKVNALENILETGCHG